MAVSAVKARKALAKRAAQAFNPDVLLDPSFPQQNAFIADPAKLKALFCTRRSGKSMTASIYMIYEALKWPGCNCVFIALTRLSARGIVWKDCLKVINRKYKLGAKFNEANLTMTLTNGSVIQIVGANDGEEEMNKLLGRKFRTACIDESSMFSIDVGKLVYGVLKPAMTDMDGTICMMGTASNFTRGLFYDITTGKEPGWSLHQWSAHDNPFVAKRWAAEIAEIDTLRPLFRETPLFKQWYLNQWIVDTDKLVYRYNPDRNSYKQMSNQLSPSGWTYILGVDTGWEDDNAFVLTAFHENDPKLYVVDTYNRAKMTFDEVVAKIREYMMSDRAPAKVIIDGANKQGVESMRQRSAIPFEYADKTDKATFIELLNSDMIQAKIKIHHSLTTLRDELMGLVWKTDSNDKISIPKREHPALSNHLCDAFLYAWRNGFHYQSTVKEKPVTKGTMEWYLKQSDEIWEREREHLEKQEQFGADGGYGWPTDS